MMIQQNRSFFRKNDNDYSITKYMQTHLSDIEQLREKTELYTEEEAINTLYINNKIPRGSKILWRQLAYSCILKVREKMCMFLFGM